MHLLIKYMLHLCLFDLIVIRGIVSWIPLVNSKVPCRMKENKTYLLLKNVYESDWRLNAAPCCHKRCLWHTNTVEVLLLCLLLTKICRVKPSNCLCVLSMVMFVSTGPGVWCFCGGWQPSGVDLYALRLWQQWESYKRCVFISFHAVPCSDVLFYLCSLMCHVFLIVIICPFQLYKLCFICHYRTCPAWCTLSMMWWMPLWITPAIIRARLCVSNWPSLQSPGATEEKQEQVNDN